MDTHRTIAGEMGFPEASPSSCSGLDDEECRRTVGGQMSDAQGFFLAFVLAYTLQPTDSGEM